jgi:hypothetical protein
MNSATKVDTGLGMSVWCAEHNEPDHIRCCPFPGCTRGVASDEIVVQDRVLGDQVHQRAKWTLPDGGFTYTWEEPRDMWVLRIKQLFWREAVRLRIIPPFPETPPVLYQYTRLEGLMGIVKSNEVWLTDYSYLNDTSEVHYGLRLAKERFGAVAHARPDAAEVLKGWGNSTLQQHRVCVASFSTDGDSLSQWRAYGLIAVGFQSGPLAFGYSNSSRLDRVIYDPGTQSASLDLLAHLVASAVEHDQQLVPNRVAEMYRDGSDYVLNLIANFKAEGFKDEREVRIVHSENPDVYHSLSIKRPEKHFRISGDLIVPYVTTKDIAPKSYPKRLPIVEVVIGPDPKASVLRNGVEEFLRAHGHDDAVVRISTTPFRR